MEYTWYYLDPDNNKDDPDTLHCARCKRTLKQSIVGEGYFQGIVIHPKYPWYRIAGPFEKGNGMIGGECHKKMIKEYGEQK